MSAAATVAANFGGYTSTQLAGDYGLNQLFAQGRTGIGQTIGIVEFEQFSSADIAAFEACYGLSNPVRTVTVDGTPGGSAAGAGEAAVDVETAAVNAPSASIVVYEAPNETTAGTALDLYNRIASDDVAQVVTTSWGECEQNDTPSTAAAAENAIFERMAAQGQTMVAASGDEGSEDCFNAFTNPSGTQLAVDDPGSRARRVERGWHLHGQWRRGHAVGLEQLRDQRSGRLPGLRRERRHRPRVLLGLAQAGVAERHARRAAVPDISSSADPAHGVVFYFGGDGGWTSIGGTSVVSPEIGGFLADVDQGCNSTIGLVAPALYTADNFG